jgi:hypothetical protein
MSMPITVRRPAGPFANASRCFTSSMVATPIPPPIIVAQGEARCMMSGKISPAPPQNTTPAARC